MVLPQQNSAQPLEHANIHQFIDTSKHVTWDHQTIRSWHEINVGKLKRYLKVVFAYKQSM